MQPINTLFFDWGGVIAGDPGEDFLMRLLRDVGADQTQAAEIYDTCLRELMRGSLSEAGFWQLLRDRYNLVIHDSISDEFKKWKGLQTDQSVMALVKRAQAAGLRVALLTNVIEPTYNALQQAGCYEGFDGIIASCKVGVAKPDPAIYELALRQLKATPAESVFIDDKQKNLLPAQALGFRTVLAESPAQIIRDVSAYIP